MLPKRDTRKGLGQQTSFGQMGNSARWRNSLGGEKLGRILLEILPFFFFLNVFSFPRPYPLYYSCISCCRSF